MNTSREILASRMSHLARIRTDLEISIANVGPALAKIAQGRIGDLTDAERIQIDAFKVRFAHARLTAYAEKSGVSLRPHPRRSPA